MSPVVQKALSRIESLGRVSDSPSHLVRTFLSSANLRAARLVLGWMEELGMETSHAADGTIRGVFPGTTEETRPLLLGSHLDTVIDAGRYDGALGIIAALAALETMVESGGAPAFPVHVLGFSDEEGIRFQTTYLGSRPLAAPLDAASLAATDADGITLAEAIAREGWHEGAVPIRYEPGSLLGYVELHIEQGRVLEEEGLAACAVTAIAGQSRLRVSLTGRADHAGTTPMPLRRDALCGAAECILAAESLARETPPLVVTVGRIEVHPGASNSVPQSALFTIDLRHPDDAARTDALTRLEHRMRSIATNRGLSLQWMPVQDGNAVVCDPALTSRLLDAAESVTGTRLGLASGAGHDAVALSAICPVGMIFVRCRGGLSHHPDEHASPEDIAAGIGVLARFLQSPLC